MKNWVIRVDVCKKPELYEALVNAALTHTPYENCYVMQYSENVGGEGQKVAEFVLREDKG